MCVDFSWSINNSSKFISIAFVSFIHPNLSWDSWMKKWMLADLYWHLSLALSFFSYSISIFFSDHSVLAFHPPASLFIVVMCGVIPLLIKPILLSRVLPLTSSTFVFNFLVLLAREKIIGFFEEFMCLKEFDQW